MFCWNEIHNRIPVFYVFIPQVKRFIMTLPSRYSAQMWKEVHFIQAQVNAVYAEAYSNFPHSFARAKNQHLEELAEYKVRLEELVCKTDIKEQSKMIFGAFKSISYFDFF